MRSALIIGIGILLAGLRPRTRVLTSLRVLAVVRHLWFLYNVYTGWGGGRVIV
eukprot:COSAG01_NODE_2481_length_7603_cov_4.629398_2_plen_53_part_00